MRARQRADERGVFQNYFRDETGREVSCFEGPRAAASLADPLAYLAAGAYVATGAPGVVMFQNSGLGNAVNALTSLNWPFRIPALIVVTHRAQPGGPADEPQHELMGQITTQPGPARARRRRLLRLRSGVPATARRAPS